MFKKNMILMLTFILCLAFTNLVYASSDKTVQINENKSSVSQNEISKHQDEMYKKYQEAKKFHEAQINKAKENKEKLYTFREILSLEHNDLQIPKKDLDIIKSKITDALGYYDELLNSTPESMKMTYEEHQAMLERIKLSLSEKYAKSEIFIDKQKLPSDLNNTGEVQVFDVPSVKGCIDDNGWGYQYFIMSDCNISLNIYRYCSFDILNGIMGYPERYCQYGIRNCSPTIGHYYWWHDDGNYSGW